MTHTDDKAYFEALENADREARATFAGALLVALFFWGAIALFKDSDRLAGGLPLWFWAAVIGGYLLSVAVVWWLVRFVFRPDNLDFSERGAAKGDEA